MRKTIIAVLCVNQAAVIALAGYLFLQNGESKRLVGALVKKIESLNQENRSLVDKRKQIEGELKSQRALAVQLAEEKKILESESRKAHDLVQILGEIKENNPRSLRVRLKQLKIYWSEVFSPDAGQNQVDSQKNMASDTRKLFDDMFAELNMLAEFNAGNAYSRAQLFDKAFEAYEGVLKTDPQNPDANYNLGIISEHVKKDAVSAIGFYKKYLECAPDAKDRAKVQSKIDTLAAFGSGSDDHGGKRVSVNQNN